MQHVLNVGSSTSHETSVPSVAYSRRVLLLGPCVYLVIINSFPCSGASGVAPQGGGGGGGGASETELERRGGQGEGGHSEGELDIILQEQLARLRSSWYRAPDRGAASPRPVRCRLAGDLTWAGGGTPH